MSHPKLSAAIAAICRLLKPPKAIVPSYTKATLPGICFTQALEQPLRAEVSDNERGSLKAHFFDTQDRQVCEIIYCIDNPRPTRRLIVDVIHTERDFRRQYFGTRALHYLGKKYGLPIVPVHVQGLGEPFWEEARRLLSPFGVHVSDPLLHSERIQELEKIQEQYDAAELRKISD